MYFLGWPQTHRDLPASTSHELGLKSKSLMSTKIEVRLVNKGTTLVHRTYFSSKNGSSG